MSSDVELLALADVGGEIKGLAVIFLGFTVCAGIGVNHSQPRPGHRKLGVEFEGALIVLLGLGTVFTD